MQEPEEPAAKAETERRRTFHFVGKARVVEPQLPHGRAQILEICGIDGKKPAKHHGLRGLEAGQRRVRRPLVVGDRVPDARVGHLLDLRGDEADFARPQRRGFLHFWPEEADAIDLVARIGAHHADALALAQIAVDDAHEHDDAEVGIVPRGDEQRL